MTDGIRHLIIGHAHPDSVWAAGNGGEHAGDCKECGGQCDGGDCGLHAAGCVFGGFAYGYWMFAEDRPLWHGMDIPERYPE